MKLLRNRHPAGRLNNLTFGLAQLADGMVRVFSLGFLHSTVVLDHSKRSTRKAIRKMKEN